MDWADERYVRLYTRDTPEWTLLGWEGQTVLMHLLRKVDRAGVLVTGRHTPARAIMALTRLPAEVVEPGLDALLADGTLEHAQGALVIPNFLEAQEARSSDKARQRASRERRRDKSRAETTSSEGMSQNVTSGHTESHGVTDGFSGRADDADNAEAGGHAESRESKKSTKESDQQSRRVTTGHAVSQNVTSGHTESHGVTPCHPVPSCTKYPPNPPGGSERDLAALAKRWQHDRLAYLSSPQPSEWPELQQIAEVFTATWGRPAQLAEYGKDPRVRCIVDRLAEGRTVDELLATIRGAKLDPVIRDKPGNQTLNTILRDAGQIDKFASLLEPDSDPIGPSVDEAMAASYGLTVDEYRAQHGSLDAKAARS